MWKLVSFSLALSLLGAAGCNKPARQESPPGSAGAAAPAAPAGPAEGAAATSAPLDIPITARSFEAVQAFRRGRHLLDNFREAEARPHLQRALELDPGFAQAHAYLALTDMGAEGLLHIERAQALLKDLPPVERLFVEATIARALGETERLAALRRQLAQAAPSNWRVQEQLGRQALAERKWDEAIKALRRAIELNPDTDAYNELGYTLASQGKFDEAIAVFRDYGKLKPAEPNVHDSLGEVLMRAGRLPEAEATFRKAAETDGFWHGWEGVAYTRLLRDDWAGGREALEKARAAARLPADQLSVDLLGAWASLAEGKAADADKRLLAIEKLAHDQGAAVVYAELPLDRAVVHLAQGKPAEALKQVALSAQRADGQDVPSGVKDTLRRRGLIWRLVAESRLGKIADADKTLGLLAGEARAAPSSAWLQSALHFGRGLLQKEPRGAVDEMGQCIEDDVFCRWELLRAQEKLADPAAAETRRRLLGDNWRDPLYLYVRAQVAAAHAKSEGKKDGAKKG